MSYLKVSFCPNNKSQLAARFRGIAEIDEHFFIVSKEEKKHVLDICGGKKGGKLISYPARLSNNDNQTWKMDAKGRIKSRSGLVADISGSNKDSGADVVAWTSHSGINQLWSFEDGFIKSNLNGLVLQVEADNQEVKTAAQQPGKSSQQWILVPEALYPEFLAVEENNNPLEKAAFFSKLYSDYFWTASGFFSIEEFEQSASMSLRTMKECAEQLDKVASDTGISTTVGGAAGITGGVLSILGLCAAPFTFGLSLGLTIGGAAVGVAGGAATLTGSLINQSWEHSEKKEFQLEFAALRTGVLRLQSFMHLYNNMMIELKEFLETEQGQRQALDMLQISGNASAAAWETYKLKYALVEAKHVFDQTKGAVKGVKDAYKGAKATVDAIKDAKFAKNTLDFLGFVPEYVANELALGAAAPQVSLPTVKVLGRTLYQGKTIAAAGSKLAVGVSAVFSVVGIAFGIWDVVEGANKISNGSELAEEFQKASEELEGIVNDLVKMDEELRALKN